MSNYPARWKVMLKGLGVNNKKVSEITGRTYGTVRGAVMPNTKNFPHWAKLAVWMYEEHVYGFDFGKGKDYTVTWNSQTGEHIVTQNDKL